MASSRPLLDARQIASYAIQDPKHPNIQISQVVHRIQLVELWGIFPSARVLEIGCGQGDCTIVLAETVGPNGHVDAVDPAPGDYGAPFTLAQAHEHVTASKVGNLIEWHQADPIEFLASNENKWDFVVLAHCIWYFKSPNTLKTIFDKLVGRTDKVCIAEYALSASLPSGIPHVLAALTQATLEAHRDSSANIQSLLTPAKIKGIAAETQKWQLGQEATIVPKLDLDDGRWEVGTVVHAGFVEEVASGIKDERVKLLIESMRDSTVSAVAAINGTKNANTMDVWAGVFS